MKSKASIKGHPIHPMLIPFPIAFLTGCVFADLAGIIFDWPSAWQLGAILCISGVITGLVAAGPGIIDYIYIVPPESSAHVRATYHMIVNTVALGLFLLAWLIRPESAQVHVMIIELIGLSVLTVGGWMGGVLVFRNQIGVDHRYAHAGKWNEIEIQDSLPWTKIAKADELKINQMKLIKINGKRVVLANTEKGYFAFDDRCTHRGASLADGTLGGCIVTCPWHGSQFYVNSGELLSGPAKEGIKQYSIEVRNQEIWLSLEDFNADSVPFLEELTI